MRDRTRQSGRRRLSIILTLGALAVLGIIISRAFASTTVTVTLTAGPPPAAATDSLFADQTFADNVSGMQAALAGGGTRTAYLPGIADLDDITVSITVDDILFDDATRSIALPVSATVAGQPADLLLVAQWADASSVVPVLSVGVRFDDLDLATLSDAWQLPVDAPDPLFPETWIAIATDAFDLTPFSEPDAGDPPVDLERLISGGTTPLVFFPNGFEITAPGVVYASTLVLDSVIGEAATEALGYVARPAPGRTEVDLEGTIATSGAIFNGGLSDTAFSVSGTLPAAPDPIAGFLRASGDWTATFDYTVPSSPGDATFSEATDIWTFAGHGLEIGDTVTFLAGGTDADPYASDTEYFVIAVPDDDTFQLSATDGGPVIDGTSDSGDPWPIAPDPNPLEFGLTGQVEPYDDPATTTDDPAALTGLPPVDIEGTFAYTPGGDIEATFAGVLTDVDCTTPPFAAGSESCWKDALSNDWLDLSNVTLGLEFTLDAGDGEATATATATFDPDEASGPLAPFDLSATFGYVDGSPPTISAEVVVETELSLDQVVGLYLAQGRAAAAFPGQDDLRLTQASFFVSTTGGDASKFALTGQAVIFDDVTVNSLVALTQVSGEDLLLLGVKTDGLSFTETFEGLFDGPNDFQGDVLGEITMPEVIYTFAFPQGSPSVIDAPYDIPIGDLGENAQEFFDLTGPGASLKLGGTFSIEGTVDLADLGDDVLGTFGIAKDPSGKAEVDYTGTANASFDWGGGNGGGFTFDSLELTAALPGASLTVPEWLQDQLDSGVLDGARIEDLFLRFEYGCPAPPDPEDPCDPTETKAELRTNLFADLDDQATAGDPSLENVAIAASLSYDGSAYDFEVRGDIQKVWNDDGDLAGPAPCPAAAVCTGDWEDPFGIDITLSDAYIELTYQSGSPPTATAELGGTIPVGTATLDVTIMVTSEGSGLAADLTAELIGSTKVPLADIIDLAQAQYGVRPIGAPPTGPSPVPFPGDLTRTEDLIDDLVFGPGIIEIHIGEKPTFLAAARTEYVLGPGTPNPIPVAADGLFTVNEDLEFLAGVSLDRQDLTLGEIAADFGPVVPGSPPPVILPPVADLEVPEVTLVVANAEVRTSSTEAREPVFDFFKHLYGCAPAEDQTSCEEFDIEVDPGATLFSAVHLPDSLLGALEILAVQDDPVLLKGFLPLFGSTLDPFFEAQLPEIVPLEAVDPNSDYWLRKIQLSFRVSPTAYSFAGTTTLRFGEGADRDDLALRLGVTADTVARSLQLSASLDATINPSGVWESPFGIEWLDVRGLAVQIDIGPDPLPTSPTYGIEVGLFGAFEFGTKDLSASVLVDIPATGTAILRGVRAASASGVDSGDLIAFQQAFSSAVLGTPQPPLSFGGLPGIALRNVEFQYADDNYPLLCLQQGVVIKGDLYINPQGGGDAGPIDLDGPCASIPDRPSPSTFCLQPANRTAGCFASVRLKIDTSVIEAAGSLGRFRLGPALACPPFGGPPDPSCVLVFEGASVDLKVAREGASLTDRLLLSGRARVPGLVAGVPDFLEGQVDLEIRATKRSFTGDFKVFGAFFALVDAEVGVAGGLPFDPSAAGFDVTAKFRAGFSSAVAAIAEPLVTEIKRVLEIVGPIVDDLTGAGSDPATVLANLPGRLNQIGVPVPAEVGKISTAVGTFLSAVDAAKAPFRAFNAVAGEFGLPTIPEPSLPLTPGQIVEAALTGYDLGQLTDNPFGFEGFEVPRIPELCNGGLGTFVNGTCYTSPPTDPVYEYACLLWPLDDVCDWVLVWPGSPGVEGIATPSFCPPFSAEAPDGRCYAGVLPVPAPTIPGACATVPGFLPAGAGCSFGSILLTVLDAPLRIALGAVLDIDITDTATYPSPPSLSTALSRLDDLFDDPGSIFTLECAQLRANVGQLQQSDTAALGISATIFGTTFGDTVTWNFDYTARSAFELTKQLLESAFGVRSTQVPQCTSLGAAPVLPPRNLTLTLPTSTTEGSTVTLSGAFVADSADHSITIDWGDESPTQTITLTGGGRSFAIAHTYADDVAPRDAAGNRPTGTPSDTYTVSVRVNDPLTGETSGVKAITVNNVVPTLSASALASTITENGFATISGTVGDVGVLDTHTLVIDWKDGPPVTVAINADGSFAASHQYLDDNPTGTASDVYGVVVTVTDDDSGRTTRDVPITVENADPSALDLEFYPTTRATDGTFIQSGIEGTVVAEGDWITVEGSFVDPGSQDRHTVVIEWNDDAGDELTVIFDEDDDEFEIVSSTTTRIPLAAGERTFVARHKYYDDNPSGTASDLYPVSVTVIDDDTGDALDEDTTITVNNVAPFGLELVFGLLEIDENDVVELTATFTDPGVLDTHTAVIDWGDGSGLDTVVLEPPEITDPSSDGSEREFFITHRYLDDDPTGTPVDSFTLTLTLEDDDLGIAAGGTTTFLTTTVDASGNIVTTEETGVTPPVVVVADVPPEVVLDITPRIDENDVATLVGTFFDPGTLDGWTVDIDWGDGSPTDGFTIADGAQVAVPDSAAFLGAGVRDVMGPVLDPVTQQPLLDPSGNVVMQVIGVEWTFTMEHQYLDDDPTDTATDVYTVTATVVDDDTLVGVDPDPAVTGLPSDTIIVDNVLPTIEAGSDHFVFEDDLVSLSGAGFTDIGTVDTHTAAVYWGDGTEVDVVAVTEYAGPPGVPAPGAVGTLDASHRYAEPGIYRATVCIVDDDERRNPVCDTFTVTVVNAFLKFAAFGDSKYVKIYDDVVVTAAPGGLGGVGGNDKVKIGRDAAIAGDTVSVEGSVDLSKESVVDGDVVAGRDVDLGSGSLVIGDVDAGRSLDLDGSRKYPPAEVLGTATVGPQAYAFPDVRWVHFDVESGHENRTIRGTELLELGDYRYVTVKSGTLRLDAGLYRVKTLRAYNGTVIEIDLDPDGDGVADPLVIEVEKYLRFGDRVEMRIVSPVGDASDVLVLVDGGSVSLRKDGTFLGTFIADDGKAELGSRSTLDGALAGESAYLRSGSSILYRPALHVFAGHLLENLITPAADVLLTVDAGVDQRAVFEDDLVVLDPARFFDRDLPVDHTATIDWGDGTVDAGTVDELAGTVAGGHRYADPGDYVVTVCVFDVGPAVPACQRDTILVTALSAALKFAAYGDSSSVSVYRDAIVVGGVGGTSYVKLSSDAVVGGDAVSVERDVEVGYRSVVGGDVVAGRDARLRGGATVAGDVDAGRRIRTDGSAVVGGVETSGPSAFAFPAIRWFDFEFFSGKADVKVRGVETLDPGIYGKVDVDWGMLRLGSGVYRLRELKADSYTTIEITLTDRDGDGIVDPIVIEVEKSVDLDRRVDMVVLGGDATDVLVLVGSSSVKLGDDGMFFGTFIADDGKVELGRRAVLEGGMYGRSVKIGDGAELIYRPALDLVDARDLDARYRKPYHRHDD